MDPTGRRPRHVHRLAVTLGVVLLVVAALFTITLLSVPVLPRVPALNAAVRIPLVMHGGTGIPEKDIRRSVELGIAKVNVASELVHGYRGSLTTQWQAGRNLWTPIAMAEATRTIAPVVEKWIRITGSAGMA